MNYGFTVNNLKKGENMKIIIEGTAEEIQALMQKELCCEQSSSNQWFPEDSNRKYYEKSTSGPNLKK